MKEKIHPGMGTKNLEWQDGYTKNELYMPVKSEALEDGFRQESTGGELASTR